MGHEHAGGVLASGKSVVGQEYSEMINQSMGRVAVYI